MEIRDLRDYVEAAKGAVERLKSSYRKRARRREKIEARVKTAEDILRDAQFAEQIGVHLCDCTWPPRIMLWDQQKQAHVCPNPDCGRREKPKSIFARW